MGVLDWSPKGPLRFLSPDEFKALFDNWDPLPWVDRDASFIENGYIWYSGGANQVDAGAVEVVFDPGKDEYVVSEYILTPRFPGRSGQVKKVTTTFSVKEFLAALAEARVPQMEWQNISWRPEYHTTLAVTYGLAKILAVGGATEFVEELP